MHHCSHPYNLLHWFCLFSNTFSLLLVHTVAVFWAHKSKLRFIRSPVKQRASETSRSSYKLFIFKHEYKVNIKLLIELKARKWRSVFLLCQQEPYRKTKVVSLLTICRKTRLLLLSHTASLLFLSLEISLDKWCFFLLFSDILHSFASTELSCQTLWLEHQSTDSNFRRSALRSCHFHYYFSAEAIVFPVLGQFLYPPEWICDNFVISWGKPGPSLLEVLLSCHMLVMTWGMFRANNQGNS